MDAWTLFVAGLVILPILGMIAVFADIADAHHDLVLVRQWTSPPCIEEEQAKHNLWSQMARGVLLLLVAGLAMSELLDVLNRWGIAGVIYLFAIVLVADAIRSRRTRKRMVELVRTNDTRVESKWPVE